MSSASSFFFPTSFRLSQNTVFPAIDNNGDGQITRQELAPWMNDQDPDLKKYDANESGFIERDEFTLDILQELDPSALNKVSEFAV